LRRLSRAEPRNILDENVTAVEIGARFEVGAEREEPLGRRNDRGRHSRWRLATPNVEADRMDTVFVLWHSHHTRRGETEDKLIGIYTSEAEAEAAKICKLRFEGFRDTPDGFLIEECELNRDQWSEGYVSMARTLKSR
jgi:hypothetical protein